MEHTSVLLTQVIDGWRSASTICTMRHWWGRAPAILVIDRRASLALDADPRCSSRPAWLAAGQTTLVQANFDIGAWRRQRFSAVDAILGGCSHINFGRPKAASYGIRTAHMDPHSFDR
jgi:hypothetical protein